MENRKSTKKEYGFTLIEVIISIFILSVAVIGVYNAFSVMAVLAGNSSDNLTAAYLSQEGIEIVANIRDENWIGCKTGNCPWNSYLADPNTIDCSSGCQVDYTSSVSPGLNPRAWVGNGDLLNIDSNGFYSYQPCTSGVKNCATKFKRKITITCLPSESNCYSMKVISDVSWNEKSNILKSSESEAGQGSCNSENCIETEETLYNWY